MKEKVETFLMTTFVKKRRRLIKFLMGLNDSFFNIRGLIMNTKPLPSIAQAFAMFVNDERQRSVSITKSTACVVYRGNSKPPYKGDSKGQSEKSSQKCTNCGGAHLVEKCYWIHGFPSSHPLHGKALKYPRHHPNMINNTEKHAIGNQKSVDAPPY